MLVLKQKSKGHKVRSGVIMNMNLLYMKTDVLNISVLYVKTAGP